MARYPKLSTELARELDAIEPSLVGGINYHPCAVWSDDGRHYDCVYIVEENGFHRYWGIWPEDDPAKRHVSVVSVQSIEASPSRLPAKFAAKIYDAGESGMGYFVFSLRFAGGLIQPYVTGGALDFLAYPAGFGPNDVTEAKPQPTLRPSDYLSDLPYCWCLYSE
jgi:hypothetical protein